MAEQQAPKKIRVKSLDDYLEVMSKAVFQSGMSWKVVEAKWETTCAAFGDFAIAKVARLSEAAIDKLAKDTRVIRNRRKLAAIVSNANKIVALDKEHGSFKKYLRSHGDFAAARAAVGKDFKFMGPMGAYFFLYVTGEKVPPHDEVVAASK